ncbi:MAG: hypothetical protein D3910_20805 [Candidatus Electrothrix sp. ATG2]|nr:hypothetical protein [Candidatus Electrothrix sp. ATG2]
MTFHCKNYDIEKGQCKRLSGECVPARKGCVLEGRIAVSEELAGKIQRINEETLLGAAGKSKKSKKR